MGWEWRHATPEDVGFAADIETQLGELAARPEYAGLHGVVAARNDAIFLEANFAGEDECWGTPLGRVDFDADTLHDMRSVSKSVVGLLYGIALGEGLVPPPDSAILDAFPDYAALAEDPTRRALTIENALTMTLGIE